MSMLKNAVTLVKELLSLTEKVNSTGRQLGEMAEELRSHDRRLIRIETIIDIVQNRQFLLNKADT